MSVAVCPCEELSTAFRYCEEHHAYLNGTKRLTSVTRVIDSVIPRDFSGIDPATVENARDRGVQTDSLFCSYISGTLDVIPAGTRLDAISLFEKLVKWWHSEKRGKPEVQVVVHDDAVAGRLDFWCDGTLYDLKCVYTLQPHYPVQLAAYASLATTLEIDEIQLVHITERFRAPKLVDVDMVQAMVDWDTVRRAWDLQRRLSKTA